MGKREKLVMMMLLLLAVGGLLCACGRGDDRQRGINGYLYVAEQVPLGALNTQNYRIQNGCLYYLDDGSLYRMPFEEEASDQDVKIGLRELVTGEAVSQYTVDEASSVYYFQSETRMTDQWTTEITGGVLKGKREDGSEIFRRKFDFTSGEAVGLTDVAVDGRGRIFLMAGDTVYLTDADGEPGGELDLREYCTVSQGAQKKLLEGAGSVYYYIKDMFQGEMAVYEIQGERGQLRAERVTALGNGIESGSYGDVYGSAAGLLYNNNGLLRLYRPGELSLDELLRWTDSDLGSNPLEIVWISEDKLAAVFLMEEGTRVYLLTRRRVEELPEREELILVSVYGSQRLDRAVAAFNQNSEKYHITIEIVTRGDEDMSRLDARLVSSNPPDLLDLTYMNMLKYADRGVLEDLSPLLEGGILPGKDSYVEGLIEGYTVDGRLMALPKGFGIEVVMGRASQLGTEAAGWTMEELCAFAEENPGCRLLEMDSFEYVLEELFAEYIMEVYVDSEMGECSFDSDSFRGLMSWLEGHTARVDRVYAEGERNFGAALPQEQLLMREDVFSMNDLIYREICLGEDAAVIGYPTEDGHPSYYAVPYDLMGMVSGSRHKEGAREFLTFFLGSQEEDYTFGLPVYRDVLERELEEEQTLEYLRGADGEIWQEDGIPVKKAKNSYVIDGEVVEYYAMTKEQADRMRNVIAATDFIPDGGARDEVIGIIMEEMRTYLYKEKTLEEVTAVIQNRVRTLVQESS